VSSEDLSTWADSLEAVIQSHGLHLIDRIHVLRETTSTQDAAQRLGKAGTLVIAGRQTAARGRFGRKWLDSGLGVATTVVLDASEFSPAQLSLAGAVAAAAAVDAALTTADARAAIRWPNDIVEAAPDAWPARKIAGILVELSGGLALVGIGINVLQPGADWPPLLARTAVSLRQLGATSSRLEVAGHLLIELERSLHATPLQLWRQWGDRNILRNRHAAFLCAGARVEGIVEGITTELEIILRGGCGRRQLLPAAHTTLIHE
jgi:BirA family transcriptional regulator, biotin operon repressor / biotin---[acetyl-CoA-carboxylase] ligase